MPMLDEALHIAAALAAENHAHLATIKQLHKEVAEARAATINASKSGLLEIARLDSLVWQTADEAAALSSDLDDMQAEWAAEYQAHEKLIDTHIQCRSDLLDERRMRVAACERIMELEALDRQSVERADAQASEIARLEENIDSLNCLIEHSRLEVLEANRLRVAAFERNAELERKIQAAVNALQKLAANELLSGNVLGVLSYLRGPRRDEPGTEVMA